MDTLPDELLTMIMGHCRLDEQLVTLRLVNNRFYQLPPQLHFEDLVADDILQLSPKLQAHFAKEAAYSWWYPYQPITDNMRAAIINLFEYVASISPSQVRAIRFNKATMLPKLISTLASMCPNVTKLDFTMKGDGRTSVPYEILSMIGRFRSLNTLRLNENVGPQFAPILSRLHLRRLEIGGSDAPITTADDSMLEELSLVAPYPLVFIDQVAANMASRYPNLKVHKMSNHFCVPRNFWTQNGPDSYRRLHHLEKSDYIDACADLFLDDKLAKDLPNLRSLLLLASYPAPSPELLSSAWFAFSNLTAMSFRLTQENGSFYGDLLASITTLKSLTVDVPFKLGTDQLEHRIGNDPFPFRFRLKKFSIQGSFGLSLFTRLWFECPNLTRVKIRDDMVITRERLENFGADNVFAGRPRLRRLELLSDEAARLLVRLEEGGRLTKLRSLRTNVCARAMWLDKMEMLEQAVQLLASERLPALRHLDMSFQDMGPPSVTIMQHVFESLPQLETVKLCGLAFEDDGWKIIVERLADHKALRCVDIGLVHIADKDLDLATSQQGVLVSTRSRNRADGFEVPWMNLRIKGTRNMAPLREVSDEARLNVVVADPNRRQ